VMTSRWAYEALAVNQYKNNLYRKGIFEVEKKKNDVGFKAFYWTPEVGKYLKSYMIFTNENRSSDAASVVPLLRNSFMDLFDEIGHYSDSIHQAFKVIGTNDFNREWGNVLLNYLDASKKTYKKRYQAASHQLDQKYVDMLKRFDGDNAQLVKFKDTYTNKKMETLVRDKYSLHKTYIFDDRIYQGDEPIFRKPAQKNGTAHFYASYKLIGNFRVDTIFFDIAVLWVFTFLLMVSLYFDLLNKALTYVENWRLARQARMRDNIFYNPMAFMKGELKNNRK
jgi:ABC transport system ATP-binding/permease protein